MEDVVDPDLNGKKCWLAAIPSQVTITRATAASAATGGQIPPSPFPPRLSLTDKAHAVGATATRNATRRHPSSRRPARRRLGRLLSRVVQHWSGDCYRRHPHAREPWDRRSLWRHCSRTDPASRGPSGASAIAQKEEQRLPDSDARYGRGSARH